jgi:hypothetical protein
MAQGGQELVPGPGARQGAGGLGQLAAQGLVLCPEFFDDLIIA